MGQWVAWDQGLSIHVDKIDQQHMELIRRFNELSDAVWDGRGKEEIGRTLNFLADYTVNHFRDEEALQQLFGYPGYERHKEIHDSFVAEVKLLITKFEAGQLDSDLVVKTVEAVGQWVLDHIKKEDKAIGAFIQSKTGQGAGTSSPSPSTLMGQAALGQAIADRPPQTKADTAPPQEPPKKKGVLRRLFSWLH